MKAALGLSLFVAGVYLLTASGHLGGQDQEYYYRMARAVAHQRTFAIEPLTFQGTEIAGRRGRDGNFFAEYAPGLPTAMAPLIAFADFSSDGSDLVAANYHWMRDQQNDVLERIAVSYFDVFVIAAIAGVLFLLVRQLGYSERTAVFIGAIFAFSTFAWGHSRIINPEPLQTFFTLLAVLLTLRSTTKSAFASGCAIGCALLVKITAVVALPALLIPLRSRKASTSSFARATTAFVLPILCALSLYAFYNYARFGNLFATGYNISGRAAELGGNGIGNPVIGLFGLILSSGRGLIWYAPSVLAASVGYARFFREQKRASICSLLLIGTWLAIHACYQGWDSGWGWGPRYLLPVLPLLLLPTAETFKLRGGKAICVALAILGFLIQLPGALVDFMASGRAGMNLFAQTAREPSAAAFVAWRNFTLSGSEIVRHFSLLREGEIDVAWLTFRHSPVPIITFALATVLIVSGAFLSVSVLLDRERLQHNPTKV